MPPSAQAVKTLLLTLLGAQYSLAGSPAGQHQKPFADEAANSNNPRGDAVVSHGNCQNGPPFLPVTDNLHVPIETCIDLPDHLPLRIEKAPSCPDGSEPLLATWPALGCPDPNTPPKIAGVSAHSPGGHKCVPEFYKRGRRGEPGVGEASYMFWCDGDKTRRTARPANDKRGVYSTDTCPSSWVSFDRPGPRGTYTGMIDRVEVGVCISRFNKKDNWVVYKPPVCGNGRPARVAVWEGDRGLDRCQGTPTRVEVIKDEDLGHCVEACGESEDYFHSCSRMFWCDGSDEGSTSGPYFAIFGSGSKGLGQMLSGWGLAWLVALFGRIMG